MAALTLWDYYLYTQLPEEFKTLLAPMDQEFLNKCKKDLEDQISKVTLFTSES